MALLFCDGFENQGANSNKKWDSWSYGTSLTTARARTGSRSCGFDALHKYVPATGSTAIIGLAVYQASAQNLELVVLYNGGNWWAYAQCGIMLNASQGFTAHLRMPNSSMGVLGSSANGIVRLNQWNYVEVKIVLSQTVGTITIKLNGEQVLDLTGLDNCYLGNTGWDSFSVGTNSNAWMDDVYCCDGSGAQNNDWMGECRVVSILPEAGNGANVDFDTSAGGSPEDHGAMVDEAAPDDDTTYVSSSTVGHYDTWAFGALGYTGTIKGVQLNIVAKKTEASARAIVGVARPASTNRDHATNRYLGMTGYLSYPALWELNPEDSAAWEVADVDGAEFGVKVTV